MGKLDDLRTKRMELLKQLCEVDDQMRTLIGHLPNKAATVTFADSIMCSCGLSFSSYFKLDLHISTFASPDHRGMGEKPNFVKCKNCHKQFTNDEAKSKHQCKPVYAQVKTGRGEAIDLNQLLGGKK